MSTQPASATTAQSSDLQGEPLPRRYRFDVDEYHAMARVGIFHEDDRVELLDGEVIEMTAVGVRHAACVDRLTSAFFGRCADRAVVRVQNPIRWGRRSEPLPDVMLLAPPRERYDDAHPGPKDVLLLVEVADSSLAYDRGKKLTHYASAGVTEVWIVNLGAREIEIYREPSASGYAEALAVREGTVCSLAFPNDPIDLDEIFGPPK